jgi:hypothetical protein
LRVYTGQGSEVVFPLEGLERQLRRWRAIYDKVAQTYDNKTIATLDLSIANNLPVTLATSGPSTTKVTPPKPLKTLRTKKKHV